MTYGCDGIFGQLGASVAKGHVDSKTGLHIPKEEDDADAQLGGGLAWDDVNGAEPDPASQSEAGADLGGSVLPGDGVYTMAPQQ